MRVMIEMTVEVDPQAWLDWTGLQDKEGVPEDVANLLAELAEVSRTFNGTGASVITAVGK